MVVRFVVEGHFVADRDFVIHRVSRAVVVRGDERVTVPAHPVEHVVDVTGAGDLFASGFLFGHTHGKPLRQCAALGSLAAAEVISHTGARPEVNLLQLARDNGLI